MDLRHLEFVIAAAEHGSFTRAAEAVHVSQPSLSYAGGTVGQISPSSGRWSPIFSTSSPGSFA
jgi:LysR family cyn operon transcriptional activator